MFGDLTMCNKTNLKIKDYSRSKYFNTVFELQTVLQHDYTGRHVAIHYKTNSGMISVIFVSVSDEGLITDSYKGHEINFEEIEADLSKQTH